MLPSSVGQALPSCLGTRAARQAHREHRALARLARHGHVADCCSEPIRRHVRSWRKQTHMTVGLFARHLRFEQPIGHAFLEVSVLFARHLRFEQPIGHAFLKVSDHVCLRARDRDRQHLALGGPKLDHVGDVVLGGEDHDQFLAWPASSRGGLLRLQEHACHVLADGAFVGDQSSLVYYRRDPDHLVHQCFASRAFHPIASARKV
jgi:hypothetical protein